MSGYASNPSFNSGLVSSQARSGSRTNQRWNGWCSRPATTRTSGTAAKPAGCFARGWRSVAGATLTARAAAAGQCPGFGSLVYHPASGHSVPAELGDPRRDPSRWRGRCASSNTGRWREGYARLVDIAGHEPRIGWHVGVERGNRPEADIVTPVDYPWPEGAAILRSARDPAMAREFLRFLIETRQAEPRSEPGRDR